MKDKGIFWSENLIYSIVEARRISYGDDLQWGQDQTAEAAGERRGEKQQYLKLLE